MRQYYHICTEGLGNDLIFRTDEDYIRGMNAIGILAYRHGISILAFCLMDNHVHIDSRDTVFRDSYQGQGNAGQ